MRVGFIIDGASALAAPRATFQRRDPVTGAAPAWSLSTI